jgi:hypothetical protein
MTTRQAGPKLAFKRRRDRDVYRAAQKAVRQHIAARNQLTRLGVLRSGRAVQSDFAEWIASTALGLRLSSNAVQESYDATDSHGRKYQIKARVTSSLEASTSFDFRKKPRGFDFLVSIFFDGQYGVLGVAKIPCSVVVTLGSQTKGRFSFRWNSRTRNDPRIVWVVRK